MRAEENTYMWLFEIPQGFMYTVAVGIGYSLISIRFNPCMVHSDLMPIVKICNSYQCQHNLLIPQNIVGAFFWTSCTCRIFYRPVYVMRQGRSQTGMKIEIVNMFT
jgi:hypothetical protein